MKRHMVLGIMLVLALGIGGCIGESKYLAAVAESEAAKSDLEREQAKKNALEMQVKSLKDLNVKLADDVKLAQAELQRIKDIRDKERASIEARIKELEHKSRDLISQHRAVQQQFQDLKVQNRALKATVARYQKELKERQQTLTSTNSLVAPPKAAAPPPTMAKAVPGTPAPPPAAVPVPPTQGKLAAVNLNTASANDLVLFLGLTKDVAEKVVQNRPYRLRGELLAKNVLPRSTFEVIKDRITAAPQ